jgi:hypothetical protein
VVENEGHELTAGVQHADNIVHCGEPNLHGGTLARKLLSAHLDYGDPATLTSPTGSTYVSLVAFGPGSALATGDP